MSNAYNILVRFSADVRSAIAGYKRLEQANRNLDSSFDRTNAAIKSNVANTNRQAAAARGAAAATGAQSRALREYQNTVKSLQTRSVFIRDAFTNPGGAAEKKYLNSINGLRQGMYRFNMEARDTLVLHKGMIKTLDDAGLGMVRFKMKTDLVTRTLSNMSTNMINMGKNMQWTGRQMMVGVTAPLTMIAALSIKGAMSVGVLDREIRRLWEGTDKGLASLDTSSKNLSESWGVARTEVKKTQAIFAQAGFRDEVESLSKAATQFAAIGDFDSTEAAEMVRVIRAQGVAGKELEATLGRLDNISDDTSISLQELASALPKVVAFTRQTGVSTEQTAALLAGFTSQGIDADEAARALRGSLIKLSSGLAMMSKGQEDSGRRLVALRESLTAIQDVGIPISFRKANGELKTGLDMLQQLAAGYNELKRLGRDEDAALVLRDMFGADQGGRGTALLEELGKAMDDTTKKGNDLKRAMQIAGQDTATALERWSSQAAMYLGDPTTKMEAQIQSLINSGQELGQKLLPVATKLMEKVNSIVDAFTNMPEGMQGVILGLAGILAAIGPVVYMFGQLGIVAGTVAKGIMAPFKGLSGFKPEMPRTFGGGDEEFLKKWNLALGEFFNDQGSNYRNMDVLKSRIRDLGQDVTHSIAEGNKALVGETIAYDANTSAVQRNTAAKTAQASAGARAAVANSVNTDSLLGSASAGSGGLLDAFKDPLPKDRPTSLPSVDEWADFELDFEASEVARRRKETLDGVLKDLVAADDEGIGAFNTTQTKGGRDGFKRRVAIQEALQDIDMSLRDVGYGPGVENSLDDIARDIASSKVPDLDVSEIDRDRKQLNALKNKLTNFQNMFGFDMPITPNMKIDDDLARLKDFDARIDMFQQSLFSGLGVNNLGDFNKLNIAKTDPAAFSQLVSDSIRDTRAGAALRGLGDDDAAKALAERIRDMGAESYDDYLRLVAGEGNMPELARHRGDGGMKAAARDLGELSRVVSGERGTPQLMTDDMLKSIRFAMEQGPDMEASEMFSERFWNAFSGPSGLLSNSDIDVALAELFPDEKGASSDRKSELEKMRTGMREFLNENRKNLGLDTPDRAISGSDKGKATKAASQLWERAYEQDQQAEGLVEQLRQLGEIGDDEAADLSRRLSDRQKKAQEAMADIQRSVKAGLAPTGESLQNMSTAFRDVENMKIDIKSSGIPLSGANDLLAPTAMPKWNAPVAPDLNEHWKNRFDRAEYKNRYSQGLEREWDRQAEKIKARPLSDDERASMESQIDSMTKARKEAGESITAKKRKEIAESAELITRLNRLDGFDLSDADRSAIAQRALRDMSTTKPGTGQKKLPTEKSQRYQRRTTDFNRALKGAGLDLDETKAQGSGYLDALFGKVDGPELEELAGLNDEVLKGKTAEDKAALKKRLDELNAGPIQRNQKKHQDHLRKWLSEVVKDGKIDMDLVGQKGLPEPVLESLATALYGGVGENSQGSKAGYRSIISKVIGDDAGLNDDLMYAINTMAADIVDKDEGGRAKDKNIFAQRAERAKRRSGNLDIASTTLQPGQFMKPNRGDADLDAMIGRNQAGSSLKRMEDLLQRESINLDELTAERDKVSARRMELEDQRDAALDRNANDRKALNARREELAKRAGFNSAEDAKAHLNEVKNRGKLKAQALDRITEAKKENSLIDEATDVFARSESMDGQNKSAQQLSAIHTLEGMFGQTDSKEPLERRWQTLNNKAVAARKRNERDLERIVKQANDNKWSKGKTPDEVVAGIEDSLREDKKQIYGDGPAYQKKRDHVRDEYARRTSEASRLRSEADDFEERWKSLDSKLDASDPEYKQKKRQIGTLKGKATRRRNAADNIERSIDGLINDLEETRARSSKSLKKETQALSEFELTELQDERLGTRDTADRDWYTREMGRVQGEERSVGERHGKADQRVKGRKRDISRLNKLISDGPLDVEGDDAEVLRQMFDPAKRQDGSFNLGSSRIDKTRMLGSLSPEMAKSIHEMTVLKTAGEMDGLTDFFEKDGKIRAESLRDVKAKLKEVNPNLTPKQLDEFARKSVLEAREGVLSEARAIIKRNYPDLAEELVDDYAKYSVMASKALDMDIDNAEALLGHGLRDQQIDVARRTGELNSGGVITQRDLDRLERSGGKSKTGGPAASKKRRERSLESITEKRLGALDDMAADFTADDGIDLDPNTRRRQGGSKFGTREESLIDDLLSGFDDTDYNDGLSTPATAPQGRRTESDKGRKNHGVLPSDAKKKKARSTASKLAAIEDELFFLDDMEEQARDELGGRFQDEFNVSRAELERYKFELLGMKNAAEAELMALNEEVLDIWTEGTDGDGNAKPNKRKKYSSIDEYFEEKRKQAEKIVSGRDFTDGSQELIEEARQAELDAIAQDIEVERQAKIEQNRLLREAAVANASDNVDVVNAGLERDLEEADKKNAKVQKRWKGSHSNIGKGKLAEAEEGVQGVLARMLGEGDKGTLEEMSLMNLLATDGASAGTFDRESINKFGQWKQSGQAQTLKEFLDRAIDQGADMDIAALAEQLGIETGEEDGMDSILEKIKESLNDQISDVSLSDILEGDVDENALPEELQNLMDSWKEDLQASIQETLGIENLMGAGDGDEINLGEEVADRINTDDVEGSVRRAVDEGGIGDAVNDAVNDAISDVVGDSAGESADRATREASDAAADAAGDVAEEAAGDAAEEAARSGAADAAAAGAAGGAAGSGGDGDGSDDDDRRRRDDDDEERRRRRDDDGDNRRRRRKGGMLNPLTWVDNIKGIRGAADAADDLGEGLDGAAKKGGPLTLLFGGMSGSMGVVLTSVGALLLGLAPFIAMFAYIAVTFDKWKKGAKEGINAIKVAFGELKNAIAEPFRELFGFFSETQGKGSDAMGTIANFMNNFLTGLAKIIRFMAPIIETVVRTVVMGLYGFYNFFMAFIALISGDWEAFGLHVVEVWRAALWALVGLFGQLGLLIVRAFKNVGVGIANTIKAMIDGITSLVRHIPGLDDFKMPGAGVMDDWRDRMNSGMDEVAERYENFMADSNPMSGFTFDFNFGDEDKEEEGEDAFDEYQDGFGDGVLDAPEVEAPTSDQVNDFLNDFIGAFQSQMRKVVDGWKEAALAAYDDWAKAQVQAVDDKIEAIDKEVDAERKRDQDLDYLRRKEELRNRRRSEALKHSADRDLAIYEGRYDDAKQLDYDYGQTLAQLQKDEREIEKDRQQTLTDRVREGQKERLQMEKENVEKVIALRREQLQRELDAMTEYIPKNVGEAQRMQQSILGKMREFTNGYGAIGHDQAAKWGAGWSTAFAAANKQVSEQAYWAGASAMNEFARALGIDPKSLNADKGGSSPAAPSAPTGGSGSGNGQGLLSPEHNMSLKELEDLYGKRKYHTGGTVGNLAQGPRDVDATLQTGEYVIQRSAVRRVGKGALDAINSGVKPIFHSGGMVGAAVSAMGPRIAKAAQLWAQNKTSLRFGSKSYTADNYRAALQAAVSGSAAAPMGGSPVGGGGEEPGFNNTLYQGDRAAIKRLNPEFYRRFLAWNHSVGGMFSVGSGWRSWSQQQQLYNAWLAKVPGQAQAAPPGRSNHNYGLAIDLSPSRTTASQRAAGARFGLRWPMSFEPWHVEPIEAKSWRALAMGQQGEGDGSLVGVHGDTGGLALRPGFVDGTSNVGGLVGTMPPIGSIKAIVRGMLPRFGWGMDQWGALERLVQKESSWNPKAANPSSSARGLFQKMTSLHGPVEPTVEGQATWGMNYIKGRYRNPANALAFHLRNNWYHKGGMVFPSMDVGGQIYKDGIAKVHAGETVLTAGLSNKVEQMLASGSDPSQINLNFDLSGYMGSQRELEKLVDTIETRVVPKIQRAQGTQQRKFGKVTK